MQDVLKFQNTASVGDLIKAYDFKPMEGTEDVFMSGVVTAKGPVIDPESGFLVFRGYTIKILGGSECYKSQIGKTGYIPYEVSIMEYDERVQLIATQEEINLVSSNP